MLILTDCLDQCWDGLRLVSCFFRGMKNRDTLVLGLVTLIWLGEWGGACFADIRYFDITAYVQRLLSNAKLQTRHCEAAFPPKQSP